MRDFVLSGSELGVSLRVAFGDEDGIPPEPSGAPRLGRNVPLHLPDADAHVTICQSDSDGTDGEGREVLLDRKHL
ncbi:MAG: hypothetical protein QOI57_1920, partial [Rubrobacteraceae bacterium]|nr:hypothetical protein [Rubrobacteraceae bacterium]